MRAIGVDLAAADAGTALAVLDETAPAVQLTRLHVGVSDAQIVDAVGTDAVLGLDCPVGWPDAFVDFVGSVRRGEPIRGAGGAWRKTLTYRATDDAVHRRVGRWPLSVSADRLGVTAMRGAALLTALRDAGVAVDRSAQSGRVFEVYPGAALLVGGFDSRGYRVDSARRAVLLDELRRRAPWLDLGGHGSLMIRSADAFDAVLSALVARAAARGLFEGPPRGLAAQASREGWVVLPAVDIARLAPEGWPAPAHG